MLICALASAVLATGMAQVIAQESPGASAFEAGRDHYTSGQYELAVASLEQAVQDDPGNAEYHLWLGRSYGRSAERAPWYRALPLARRTLSQFRRAVTLDPGNRAAWEALREYYRQAPGFLGGSASKAQEVDARLSALPPDAP